MPIRYNGGENPAAVKFNSTNLSAVYFAPDRNSYFTQVWGSDTNFPSSISLIRIHNSYISGAYGGVYSKRGCYDIYARNLQFVKTYLAQNIYTGVIKRIVEYRSYDCSFDLDWDAGHFIGYVLPPSDLSRCQDVRFGDEASYSGVPSTLSGLTKLTVYPDIRWEFDVEYGDYTQQWRRLTTITYDISRIDAKPSFAAENESNWIVLDPVSTPLVVEETDPSLGPLNNAAWCYMAGAGLVAQGSALLVFELPY
jgi:hypothetical protein